MFFLSTNQPNKFYDKKNRARLKLVYDKTKFLQKKTAMPGFRHHIRPTETWRLHILSEGPEHVAGQRQAAPSKKAGAHRPPRHPIRAGNRSGVTGNR